MSTRKSYVEYLESAVERRLQLIELEPQHAIDATEASALHAIRASVLAASASSRRVHLHRAERFATLAVERVHDRLFVAARKLLAAQGSN